MTHLAVDTSVAVPLLVRSHTAHDHVRSQLLGRELVLTGHSLAETYSVLTRLPGDARLAPADAADLIEDNFREAVLLEPAVAASLPSTLAELDVAGGAVYDALIGLAATGAELPLATRDRRAASTYAVVGAEVELL